MGFKFKETLWDLAWSLLAEVALFAPLVLGGDSMPMPSLPVQAEVVARSSSSALVLSHYRVIASAPEQKKIEAILGSLENVPDAIERKVNDSGGQVVIFDGALTDIEELGYLRGKTPPFRTDGGTYDEVYGFFSLDYNTGLGTAYVHQDKRTSHNYYTTELHEYGHMVDNLIRTPIQGKLSSSEEFMRIFSYNAISLFGDTTRFWKDTPKESFANFFALFYSLEKGRDWMRESFPDVHSYFENLERRIVDGHF